jgi:hypothetical protein
MLNSFTKTVGTFALMFGIFGAAAPAFAQNDDFTPFLGSYTGHVVIDGSKGPETRNLIVLIEREGEGFAVRWSTITEKPSGDSKEDSYFATFRRATANLYHTTGKNFDFGGAHGTTYAKIVDDRMTVVANLIMPDGHYEVQTYERILVPGGLKLTYKRRRDGQEMKSIEAILKRE